MCINVCVPCTPRSVICLTTWSACFLSLCLILPDMHLSPSTHQHTVQTTPRGHSNPAHHTMLLPTIHPSTKPSKEPKHYSSIYITTYIKNHQNNQPSKYAISESFESPNHPTIQLCFHSTIQTVSNPTIQPSYHSTIQTVSNPTIQPSYHSNIKQSNHPNIYFLHISKFNNLSCKHLKYLNNSIRTFPFT